MSLPAEFSEEHDRGMEANEQDGLGMLVFGASCVLWMVIAAIVGGGIAYLMR